MAAEAATRAKSVTRLEACILYLGAGVVPQETWLAMFEGFVYIILCNCASMDA